MENSVAILTVEELEKNPSARDYLKRLDSIKWVDSIVQHNCTLGNDAELLEAQRYQK